MKRLHRLIVTSATYRQTSRVSPELLKRDPRDRWLARSPRLRIDAEMARDVALKASGSLSGRVGGPSVYPPQPASVTGLAYGSTRWTPSKGADRYRRSIYTFSKRTAPFAAFTVFDAPTGENCVARRDRSNTPLQASPSREVATRIFVTGSSRTFGSLDFLVTTCRFATFRVDPANRFEAKEERDAP